MAANRESHVTDPNSTLGGKFQIAGKTVANIAAVEANTRALRIMLRSRDVTLTGSYSAASDTGDISTTALSAIRLYSAIWQNANSFAVIRSVAVGYALGAVNTLSAGANSFKMTRASAYTAAPGGTKTIVSPASHNNELRTRFGESCLTVYQATAATGLTSPTETVDTQGVGVMYFHNGTGSGQTLIPPGTEIFSAWPGQPSLVLNQNQGFDIICTTTSATSQVIRASFAMHWEEYALLGQAAPI